MGGSRGPLCVILRFEFTVSKPTLSISAKSCNLDVKGWRVVEGPVGKAPF